MAFENSRFRKQILKKRQTLRGRSHSLSKITRQILANSVHWFGLSGPFKFPNPKSRFKYRNARFDSVGVFHPSSLSLMLAIIDKGEIDSSHFPVTCTPLTLTFYWISR